MNLRIAKVNRFRPHILSATVIVVGTFIAPATAASDHQSVTLIQGTTTQATSTKRAAKKPSTTKTVSKTSTTAKGPPKIVSVERRADTRNLWDKKLGPLVPHKTFPKKCDICHIPKRWDVMRPDFHFDHKKETGYALEGAHGKIACLACHNDRKAAAALISRSCSGCHLDPHKSTLGLDCKRCHSEVNWKPIETALGQHVRTRFPLTGVHATVLCIQCHTRAEAGDYAGAPVDCYSCHQADYTKAPNHVAMNFAHTCQDCHTTTSFADALFDHSKLGANPNCYTCHQVDYQSANNPPHVGVLPTTCQQCHVTTTWLMGSGGTFDHSTFGFPLTAAHASATCVECHANNNYSIPNANCVPCHNTDFGTGSYITASAPGATPVRHDPTNYPAANCVNCHGDFSAWTNGGAFNHTAIGFPLVGAHNTACANCHNLPGVTLSGTTLTATCDTCHQSVDTGHGSYSTTSPSHSSMGWPSTPQACQQCHSDLTSWTNDPTNAALLHASFTGGFALTGLHNDSGRTNGGGVIASCDGCHANSNANISGTSCVPCHNADYATASAPGATPVQHDPTNYPTSSCAGCHGDFAAWTNGTAFNHAAIGFPLTGAHNTACANCHNLPGVTLSGNTLTATCATCHQSVDTGHGSYNTATNPMPHNATLTPTTQCQTCHSDLTLWTNGTFTNHGATGFALTGKHAAACTQCHDISPYTNSGGKISGANCVPCHNTDYATASAPGATPVQHDPTNYPTSSCASCHGDFTSWLNGTAFNHAAIGFPLTGAHNTACANCHNLAGVTLSGNTLTVTCLSCHQSIDTGHGSYNSTGPSHSSMGWPATAAACQQCHGDLTSWTNGPTNAAPIHATFTGGFSLTGAHNDSGKTNGGGVVSSCDGCHANSNSFISGVNCTPCHQQDYANASLPTATVVHDPANYPAANCASCHGDFTSWLNGTAFNHAAAGFALTGLHNTACANCHNPTLGQSHTGHACAMCHLSYDTGHGDYVNATTPIDHDMKAGGRYALPQACDNCHSYQTVWTTTIVPHPTGNCGDRAGSSTPWTHENSAPASCSDCHTSVTSMSVADGSFNCSLCHQGNCHKTFTTGQCATNGNGC